MYDVFIKAFDTILCLFYFLETTASFIRKCILPKNNRQMKISKGEYLATKKIWQQ